MEAVFITIRPFNRDTGARIDIQVASAPGAEWMGLGGISWQPAVSRRPDLTLETMDPDLMGQVQAGKATFTLDLKNIDPAISAAPELLYWNGAEITIWTANEAAWGRRVVEFVGQITDAQPDKIEKTLAVQAEVDTKLIDKPLLTLEFDGGGGLGGEAGMRGTLKPAGFGYVESIEPVWFDTVHNIGMIDGYHNTLGITWLAEGLSSFGAAVADYPTYATLQQAIIDKTVAPGRWATCLAEGLVGLGAPPAGIITCHALFGSYRAGAMMKRMVLVHAAAPAERVDTAAFDALDAAVDYPTGYWTAEQRQVRDLLSAIAASCNATPLVDWQGRVTVSRAVMSAPIATLDYSGAQEPRVSRIRTVDSEPPFYRIQARTARPAKVLTTDQVLYEDQLEDKGLFSPTETYRQGHLVWQRDGSQFLYINAAPSSGHVPPVATYPPATPARDTWWQQTVPPRAYPDGTPIDDLQPAAPGATPGAPDGTWVGGFLDPITGQITGGRPAEQILTDADSTMVAQIIANAAAELARLRDRALVFSGEDGASVDVRLRRGVTAHNALAQLVTTLIAAFGPVQANVQQLMEAFTDGETGFARFLLRAETIVEGEPPAVVGIEGLAGIGYSVLRFMADIIQFINPSTGLPMLEFDSGTGKLKTTSIVVDEVEAKTIRGEGLDTGALGASSIYQDSSERAVGTSAWVDLAFVTMTPLYGKPVEINFSCFGRCSDDDSTDYYTRLMRDDGVPVRGGINGRRARVSTDGDEIAWTWVDGSVQGRETTWTVQARRQDSSETAAFSERFMRVKEDSRIQFQTFTVDTTGGEGPTAGAGGGGGAGYNPNQELEQPV